MSLIYFTNKPENCTVTLGLESFCIMSTLLSILVLTNTPSCPHKHCLALSHPACLSVLFCFILNATLIDSVFHPFQTIHLHALFYTLQDDNCCLDFGYTTLEIIVDFLLQCWQLKHIQFVYISLIGVQNSLPPIPD